MVQVQTEEGKKKAAEIVPGLRAILVDALECLVHGDDWTARVRAALASLASAEESAEVRYRLVDLRGEEFEVYCKTPPKLEVVLVIPAPTAGKGKP